MKEVCIVSVSNYAKCTGCPPNFTYLSSVKGSCYQVVADSLNWIDAGLNCQAIHQDAHLVVIDDAVEQSAVAGMLTSINSLYQIFFSGFLHYTTLTMLDSRERRNKTIRTRAMCGIWCNCTNVADKSNKLSTNYKEIFEGEMSHWQQIIRFRC